MADKKSLKRNPLAKIKNEPPPSYTDTLGTGRKRRKDATGRKKDYHKGSQTLAVRLPDELNALLSDQVVEDQYLEYKHGDELKKGTKPGPSDTIRQYVSGFANAEGGVLIVGVD